MDFTALAEHCYQQIKNSEKEFIEKETLEEKIEYLKKKMDIAPNVRKWRKESQFQKEVSKSKDICEKGDKLYGNKEVNKAAQFYRHLQLNYF